jgi:hypothetical protein
VNVEKAIVVDTNLLVLFLVGTTDPSYIEKHLRLYPTYNARHFELLRWRLTSAPKIICTAHILTEASNLARQIAEPMRSEIMATFKRFIELADERHVRSSQASEQPFFLRLGLTDAAILSLNQDQVQVLTVDHDLHIASLDRGFDCINLTPYLFE